MECLIIRHRLTKQPVLPQAWMWIMTMIFINILHVFIEIKSHSTNKVYTEQYNKMNTATISLTTRCHSQFLIDILLKK
jgi:hypothetical protein